LLLPYLDQKDLYDKIDLRKPWDDPVNQQVFEIAKRPVVFACPSSVTRDKSTEYVAIVGPKSCFSPGEAVAINDIKDGTNETLMIVEVDYEVTIPWMAPEDADESLLMRIKADQKAHHVGGFHSLFADGSVRFISANIPKATLIGLTTRAGGETVEDF
jgi:hypothetical protein